MDGDDTVVCAIVNGLSGVEPRYDQESVSDCQVTDQWENQNLHGQICVGVYCNEIMVSMVIILPNGTYICWTGNIRRCRESSQASRRTKRRSELRSACVFAIIILTYQD